MRAQVKDLKNNNYEAKAEVLQRLAPGFCNTTGIGNNEHIAKENKELKEELKKKEDENKELKEKLDEREQCEEPCGQEESEECDQEEPEEESEQEAEESESELNLYDKQLH